MNSHLSWLGVTAAARCHLHGTRRADASCPSAVLLRIGFAEPCSSPHAGELLPRLSTLTHQNGMRYISVALSLGSPPAAVSRYSCPVELGLSSDAGFRLTPAAVQPARICIVPAIKGICQEEAACISRPSRSAIFKAANALSSVTKNGICSI